MNSISKLFKTAFTPIIISIALITGAVSLWIGMQQSVWFDEAYSMLVAKQPVAEVVHLAALDTHPPLYYLLLHYWGELFHWDVLALRLLSVIFFALSIVVVGMLLRRFFGKRVAVCAVLAVAMAPLLLRYGFEIRMYSLASFIGISATYLMVRAVSERQLFKKFWLWAGYGLLVALGVYTLYYLVLLWVAHLVWLIGVEAKQNQLRQIHKQPWLWAYAGSVALFLPWLPTFLKQMNNGALAPIGQAMNLENIIGVLTFNTVYQPVWLLGMVPTIIFIALIISFAVVAKHARKLVRASERQYLLLFAMYILVPIVLLMLLSFSRSMYVERYLAHIAIGLMVLLGCTIGIALRRPTKYIYAAVSVLVVGMLVGVTQLNSTGNFNFQRMSKPEVAAVVASAQQCNDTTYIAADPYVMTELLAYLPVDCLRFYSQWDSLGGGYAPLSGSQAQLKTTDVTATTKTLHYVYYDKPELTVSHNYAKVARTTNGNLTRDTYVAR